MLNENTLIEYFSSAKLSLDKLKAQKLCAYGEMLIEKNKVMNLTAITDDEGVAIKHYVDSILPLTMTDIPKNAKLIDVGAGAGFPSVPMCIYKEDLCAVMLDSTKKRVDFLSGVIEKLNLNATAVHSRAEEYKEYRESFDIATARAVARLNILCEYCLPFVKVGGLFLALKGKDGKEELKKSQNAISVLGGKVKDVFEYALPNGDERTLIVIEKIKPTPKLYPRASAKIAKSEL